jgi:hypothetical protein
VATTITMSVMAMAISILFSADPAAEVTQSQ